MSFPRYPRYKPSGVEWLRDVPAHWMTCRLKNLAAQPIKNGLGAASDLAEPDLPRYIRITDIAGPRVLAEDTFRSLPADTAAEAPVRLNDILFACVGATFGKSYLHSIDIGPACYAGYLARFSPAPEVDPRFVSYWSQSVHYWAQLNAHVIQSTVQNFSASKYQALEIAAPPLPEQRAIATFLDHETAKIDGLVAEQQRLIKLLKEKRQAVISHAVTKGLDPKAPMKLSGVEWLGYVPAHWVTRKLTLAFHTIGSGTTPRSDNLAYYEPGEIPWVNTGDLTDSDLSSCERLVSRMAIDDYSSLRVYPAGSLLVAMYGATTGKLGLLGFDATINQACCAFVGNDLIRTRFLFYWLLGYRAQLLSLASGGGQPNISQEVLRGLRVAAPTLAEQDRIIEHLLDSCDQADTLVAEADSAIALLQERRSALISAAVTGQIDVRNAATTEAA